LRGDALLFAEILSRQTDSWQNPETAAAALISSSPTFEGRVMLLDSDGHMLASNDPADVERMGEIPAVLEELKPEQASQPFTRTVYNARLQGEAIDIIVPVLDSRQELIGHVRITYLYDTVYEQLFRFRFLLGAILLAGLFLSAGIGYMLALNISTPIQYIAEAIYDLASGQQQEPLPLSGAEEINLQITAVNFLVARLNSLEKARRQLLVNLVHELGRPLGAIQSGLQALMRGATEDPQLLDDLLTGMDDQAKRLQILLDDLTRLHEQVLGTLELDRQPIVLNQWLPQILQPWRQVAQDKAQEYVLIIPDDMPTITADPNRLAQAIDNLVNNALKYTPHGGEITISAAATEDEVSVCVSDNGPGIPAGEQQEIFEPFFRGDRQRRIKQGMGLGLGIARDLVVAHGGRLELYSQLGKGSKFTLYIPRSVPELETP
jgi:signal transduction histidine kinase